MKSIPLAQLEPANNFPFYETTLLSSGCGLGTVQEQLNATSSGEKQWQRSEVQPADVSKAELTNVIRAYLEMLKELECFFLNDPDRPLLSSPAREA
jgi:hypothetical protein